MSRIEMYFGSPLGFAIPVESVNYGRHKSGQHGSSDVGLVVRQGIIRAQEVNEIMRVYCAGEAVTFGSLYLGAHTYKFEKIWIIRVQSGKGFLEIEFDAEKTR